MKGIYCMRDNVARAVTGGLHLFHHDAPAVRMFTDIANDQQTTVHRHLADFDLLRVGVIDEDSGTVEALAEPHVVLTGAALLALSEKQGQPMPEVANAVG